MYPIITQRIQSLNELSVLLLVLLELLHLVVVLGLDVHVVVTLVILELAQRGKLDNVGAHAVKEVLRVRYKHKDARVYY